MKNLFLKSIILAVLVASFASCTVREPYPSNEIISNNGIKIILEWRTGSSSLQALEDSDLDLFLLRGANQVRWSENTGNFEMIILEDIFADGEYIVAVGSREITKNTEYTVYISDMAGDRVVSVTSDFGVEDQDVMVDFVTIFKMGNKYMVTQI